jgi:hypothetical protein
MDLCLNSETEPLAIGMNPPLKVGSGYSLLDATLPSPRRSWAKGSNDIQQVSGSGVLAVCQLRAHAVDAPPYEPTCRIHRKAGTIQGHVPHADELIE